MMAMFPCARAFAYQQKLASKPRPVTLKSIYGVLDRLSGLPVEYRADITLAILQQSSARIPLARQMSLLKDIFYEARHAKYSSSEIDAAPVGDTVAHQQVLDLSWLPLDTLDIQARVVTKLRQTDPAGSWRLLQQVTLPSRRATCNDALTETFSSYYKVMASSLQSFPGEKLPNNKSKTAYLIGQASELKSPVQVRGFVESLAEVHLSGSDLSRVLDELAIRLPLVTGSDREMTGAEDGRKLALTASVSRLVVREKQMGINPVPLLLAYRAFLVRNLRATACADSSLDRNAEAVAFNSLDPAHVGESHKPLTALSEKDLAPAAVRGSADIEMISAGKVLNQQRHRLFLVFVANQKQAHASGSPKDYVQPIADDVNALLRYRPDKAGLTNSDLLTQYENKISMTELLTTLLPPGPFFQETVETELAYLNLNPIENVSPESWLRPWKELLIVSRPIDATSLQALEEANLKTGGAIMQPSPSGSMIRTVMHRYESDPVIAAYLAFEDTFRPTYVSFEESRR
jgi:hypothetical protein